MKDEVLYKAGLWLFASEWADAWEQQGGRFAPGTEITEVAPEPPTGEIQPPMRKYVGRLEAAWGRPLESIYEEAGIEDEEDQAGFLYYVLMECRGHGIGPGDFFDDHPGYEEPAVIDLSPFNTELSDLRDLAFQYVQIELDQAEDVDKPPVAYPYVMGDPVFIQAGMPTGEDLEGPGLFHHWTPEGRAVVVMDDVPDNLNRGMHSLAGTLVVVDRDEVKCPLKAGDLLVECDSCGHFHPQWYSGECRDDRFRFLTPDNPDLFEELEIDAKECVYCMNLVPRDREDVSDFCSDECEEEWKADNP